MIFFSQLYFSGLGLTQAMNANLFLAKQEMNALLGMKMLDLVCFTIEQIHTSFCQNICF